ncbi:mpv17-like protein 2 [Pollicipes pollicipes]|uniref:mpv17-like protein 2 n=1 Tax=Pollicipes pollicipes TaxID=41117 RepID=UPI0018854C4E|nr:mpv17-like protein 2 [Pollicipes pollicipes]
MYRAMRKLVCVTGATLGPVRRALTRLSEATFGRHLLLTNVSVSVLLSALGDSLQQRYQIERGARRSYDRHRLGYMSGCGLGVGFLCHYWYLALDRLWVGRTIGVVAKKVLLDQVVFSPILISTFLVSLEVLRGHGVQDMASTLKAKFARLYIAEWTIWPPAQAFSFYCLPTRYRVLWDNTVSLGYDVYTSYVVHDDDDDDDDLPPQQMGAIERVMYDARNL